MTRITMDKIQEHCNKIGDDLSEQLDSATSEIHKTCGDAIYRYNFDSLKDWNHSIKQVLKEEGYI